MREGQRESERERGRESESERERGRENESERERERERDGERRRNRERERERDGACEQMMLVIAMTRRFRSLALKLDTKPMML